MSVQTKLICLLKRMHAWMYTYSFVHHTNAFEYEHVSQSKCISTFVSIDTHLIPPRCQSDKMINALITESLGGSALSSSPEIMFAAHYHDSSHANPPATMEKPCQCLDWV